MDRNILRVYCLDVELFSCLVDDNLPLIICKIDDTVCVNLWNEKVSPAKRLTLNI